MTTLLSVLLTFAVAALVAAVFRRLVSRRVRLEDILGAERRTDLQARASRLIRLMTVLAFGVAAFIALSLVLAQFGIAAPIWTPRQVLEWMLTRGARMVFITVGAVVLVRLAHLAIDQTVHHLVHRHDDDLEWQRRASTLAGILGRLVSVSVTFLAALMLLEELTIDVMPVLTGAGIAGLAIGFGAQYVVRDVISGFFLILEDQVRIGDAARINRITGRVEHINLRTIVIRDVEGAVQVFPNGTITTLANLSKQFAYAVVDVRVAYSEDIDRVIQTIRDVGLDMSRDAEWSGHVLGPLDVSGVESLRDGYALVRMRFKTPPLDHGRVGSELRRRIMIAFVAHKIRPFVR